MELDVVSYFDLNDAGKLDVIDKLQAALLQKGIVGIRDVPDFEVKSRAYVRAARQFSALEEPVKEQYAPDRDSGDTEGYELGAERFKNKEGVWQLDDKKASFYAFVPDHVRNKWPLEVDLKSAYLALGELIFNTGKLVLDAIGLNESVGLRHEGLEGYGRMLHYHKVGTSTNDNPEWCGAHFDHGVFTGLIPAYYFCDGEEIEEPQEAGLYIVPSQGGAFKKINATDKGILLFQVGEFGQVASSDKIKATRHMVCKANCDIERFTFALFYSGDESIVIKSHSVLTEDDRYRLNQMEDGSIYYSEWNRASFERYRAMK